MRCRLPNCYVRNIKLIIEYDGTNYSGWQIQGRGKLKVRSHKTKLRRRCRKKTIQETLEKTLRQILQEKIKIIGSGRTDAGVHARGQVANFKCKSRLNCQNLQKALNSVLPEEIRIKEAQDVRLDFHARFAARSKLYRYTIVNNSFISPHIRYFCHLVKYPLDLKKMQQAAQYLLGKQNFRSFQAVDKKARLAVRKIKKLRIYRKDKLIYLDIEADGFLYRMVRNIVGTLIEVGRGKLQPASIKKIIQARNRVYAGPCAPAKGLTLIKVKY